MARPRPLPQLPREPRNLPMPEVVSEPELIVPGLSMEKACDLVCRKAIEQLQNNPAATIGFWTETGRRSVLVGIARRGQAAATMLIPRDEYSGLKLLEILEGKANG